MQIKKIAQCPKADALNKRIDQLCKDTLNFQAFTPGSTPNSTGFCLQG